MMEETTEKPGGESGTKRRISFFLRLFYNQQEIGCWPLFNLFVGHVPAEGFPEGVDEVRAELGLVVSGAFMACDVPLEMLYQFLYDFRNVFHLWKWYIISQHSQEGATA